MNLNFGGGGDFDPLLEGSYFFKKKYIFLFLFQKINTTNKIVNFILIQ